MNKYANNSIVQFVKFGLVGVSNTAVDWAVFYLLTRIFLVSDTGVAKALAFLIAMLNSYIWNTLWTFKKEYAKVGTDSGSKAGIFVKFAVVSLIGWGTNVLLFKWAEGSVNYQIFDKDVIPLVIASGGATLWNFFANKFWTYKKSEESRA